jgi:hypothetical protein
MCACCTIWYLALKRETVVCNLHSRWANRDELEISLLPIAAMQKGLLLAPKVLVRAIEHWVSMHRDKIV